MNIVINLNTQGYEKSIKRNNLTQLATTVATK